MFSDQVFKDHFVMRTEHADCTNLWHVRVLALLMTCLGLQLLGCGKAEYDAQMQTTIQELQYGTVFLENLYEQPTDILEQVASIRLPRLFDQLSRAWRIGQLEQGTPIDPTRIQPPFGPLPGYRFCYEKYYGSLPVYCYFAVEDAEKKPTDALLEELQKPLKAKFRAAVWKTVSLKTPTGGEITLRKISANGPQMFFQDNGDQSEADGTYELYLYSTPRHHLLVGWRAPRELLGTTKLLEVSELSLGTLEVQGQGLDPAES